MTSQPSQHPDAEPAPEVIDAIVIGAGFSGLYALHRLRDVVGVSVKAIEAGSGVGGTWHWNRYPGARCDTDGYIYCYSFDKQLLQEWSWSGRYPEQPELLSYLNHVADRYDLRRDIQLHTYVTAAHFDDEAGRWTVTTDAGQVFSAKFLITGIGHLSIAKYIPDYEGLSSFEGEWFHTSNWPSEGVDLRRRIGIIGTGSTGVQAIPVIAQEAEHLSVFMRTPQYSVPARHEMVDQAFLEDVKRNYDTIWADSRVSAGGFPWQHNGRLTMDDTEEERNALYEALWEEGGIKFALGSYKDLSMSLEASETVSDFVRAKIRELVDDPDTLESLVPTDHPFLSRRVIVDTNYFETYNRDNVSLIDLRKTPIVEMVPEGIRTTEGVIPLDVIIFATGFDAITGPFFNIDLRGRNGTALVDAWSEGPHAYLGIQAVDFPNMFMVTGPTSTTGNLPLAIENHVEWIGDCIAYMRDNDIDTIEPTAEAQEQWSERVREHSQRSLMSLTDSWFNGANIPGKPRVSLFYLGHFGRYRELCQSVAQAEYEGFVLGRLREAGDPAPIGRQS
jgi:cation diffusion facilitator CzcD-associated flavoprotein CzcO